MSKLIKEDSTEPPRFDGEGILLLGGELVHPFGSVSLRAIPQRPFRPEFLRSAVGEAPADLWVSEVGVGKDLLLLPKLREELIPFEALASSPAFLAELRTQILLPGVVFRLDLHNRTDQTRGCFAYLQGTYADETPPDERKRLITAAKLNHNTALQIRDFFLAVETSELPPAVVAELAHFCELAEQAEDAARATLERLRGYGFSGEVL